MAALGVLVTHALQFGLPALHLNHTPLRMLVNGRSFVIVFFVLSGFVLSIGLLQRASLSGFPNYVLRRMVRIYPPYAVAGLMSAALATAATGGGVPWSALGDYLLLTGTSNGVGLNSPSWSLVYEVRISLLMPALCWFIARRPALAALLVPVVWLVVEAAIAVLGIGQFPYAVDSLAAAVVVTLRYTVMFAVGSGLAFATITGRLRANQVDGRSALGIIVVSVLLLSVLLDQTSLVGAALILAAAVQSPSFAALLCRPALQFLGRISYSLYLVHFPLIAVAAAKLSPVMPTALAVLLGSGTAFLAAIVFHRLVEQPAIRASQRLKPAPPDPAPDSLRVVRITT